MDLTDLDRKEEYAHFLHAHRWYLGEARGAEIPFDEAVAPWYDNSYLPLVEKIREQKILQQVPGRISLKSGKTWPTAQRPINAVEIVYVAGYGADRTAVPMALRKAILLLAGYYFDKRGECTIESAYRNSGAMELAAPYGYRRL